MTCFGKKKIRCNIQVIQLLESFGWLIQATPSYLSQLQWIFGYIKIINQYLQRYRQDLVLCVTLITNQQLPTFPVFPFSTNHRLLQPLVFALFFNKNPASNKEHQIYFINNYEIYILANTNFKTQIDAPLVQYCNANQELLPPILR
jgi:hypothetical protein